MPRVGVIVPQELTPYWATSDGVTVKLYHGDVLDVLRRLLDGSVQCVVTSPPYWGLRDYGTGVWAGGDDGCDHKQSGGGVYTDNEWREGRTTIDPICYRGRCRKCGATRTDSQLGSEERPDCGMLGFVTLRDDLTPDEKSYVLGKLQELGVL